MMVISRTPLRVSFAGGGTDLSSYYLLRGGAVTSTTINKHMYVTVNTKFDDDIRVSYSRTEIVKHVDELRHELVREAMKLTGVTSGVEITTIADIPSRGTGLGSSSSLTVGLLNALYAYKGEYKPAHVLAEEACKIEIDILGAPIGKQDQYAAAYGGLRHIEFLQDDSVRVSHVICTKERKKQLENNLMMFYTGITRKSTDILSEQKKKTKDKLEYLDRMKELSKKIMGAISRGDLDDVGRILHENWMLKKELASRISNPEIDEMYEKALSAGALGGKLLGAGGGGFLLLYVPEENQPKVKEALRHLKFMKFEFEPEGSKIIYLED